MKRTIIITTLTALAIAGTTVSASAAGGHGRKGPQLEFSDLDANGDGQITEAELTAHAAARFAAVDTNGDGVLSAEELAARAESENAERQAKRIERMISKMDENDDGVLSAEEMQRRDPAKMISRLDADEDGAVSQEEFDNAKKRFGKRKGGGKDRGGDRGNDNN